MALCLNIDIDFFTNPKVERLTDILGEGSEIHLLRLWTYVGKHCRKTGGLADWTRDNLEAKARWCGESGRLIDTLLELKFIHPWKNGFKIHDWKQHSAHLISYDETCKKNSKNAKRGWEKRRKAKSFNEIDATENPMRVAMPKRESRNAKTKQNKTETHTYAGEEIDSFEASLSDSCQHVLSVFSEVTGRKGKDKNTKEGARILAAAIDAGDLDAADLPAVIRNGFANKALQNQTLKGIANNFTSYLPARSPPRQPSAAPVRAPTPEEFAERLERSRQIREMLAN